MTMANKQIDELNDFISRAQRDRSSIDEQRAALNQKADAYSRQTIQPAIEAVKNVFGRRDTFSYSPIVRSAVFLRGYGVTVKLNSFKDLICNLDVRGTDVVYQEKGAEPAIWGTIENLDQDALTGKIVEAIKQDLQSQVERHRGILLQ
jgi:hypothetical protein